VPRLLDSLTECDLEPWEGLDRQTISEREPDAYARFLASPCHPDGDIYREVYARASAALEELLDLQRCESVLVVSHHVVLRTYLAGLLGLPPDSAREVSIPNCAISTGVREVSRTRIIRLADTGHLENLEKEVQWRIERRFDGCRSNAGIMLVSLTVSTHAGRMGAGRAAYAPSPGWSRLPGRVMPASCNSGLTAKSQATFHC
jgi:hypothetical protein